MATFESAMVALASESQPFALESTAEGHRHGRYSILGFDPVETFTIPWPSASENIPAGWLADLKRCVGRGDPRYGETELPFVGGWVGYISYEAGTVLEGVRTTKRHDIALPAVHFGLYDTVAVFDHHGRRWTLAGVNVNQRIGKHLPPLVERLDGLEAWLSQVPAAAPIDWSREASDEPVPAMTPEEYLNRVHRAKRYIQAGDIYEVNVTQRFSAPCRMSPIDVYRRVRQSNPAPLGGLLVCGDSAIISASPELFLTLHNGRIVTRPIKGTRPRIGDEVLDAVAARELLTSEKDRAELTMIVDLLRNDLGKVSHFGTVRVASAGELETHPTVSHLVATIEGRIRSGLDWSDLLAATFPGGSITGAPKIRAMQIIEELEPTVRSVYCGAIGTIGLDGSLCLNVAIRTMVLDRRQIHLFSGGAIVADSDAQEEYDETLAKIAGLVRALGPRSTAVAYQM